MWVTMATSCAVRSDVGRKRAHNEDAYLCDDELGFYVVADGVGGHSRGEVASAEAVEQLHMWVKRSRVELDELLRRSRDGDRDARWDIRRHLEDGIQSACYMIFSMSELDPDKRGMSTTLSTVLVRDGNCYAAHVGDSRIYRVRGGEVLQVTEDHTLINYKLKHGIITAEEAAQGRGKNVITRAVGHKDYVQIDTADFDVVPGDRLLLCTDGLHNYIESDDDVLELIGEGSLEAGVAAAIAFANARGGKDNVTALAIEVT